MNFKEYQEQAHKTAEFPSLDVYKWGPDGTEEEPDETRNDASFLYPVLGLVGEAGEVAEKIKKIIRNKTGEYDDADIAALSKELGDVFWYLAEICTYFGIDMSECAAQNLVKLADRRKRDVIKSEGDDR